MTLEALKIPYLLFTSRCLQSSSWTTHTHTPISITENWKELILIQIWCNMKMTGKITTTSRGKMVRGNGNPFAVLSLTGPHIHPALVDGRHTSCYCPSRCNAFSFLKRMAGFWVLGMGVGGCIKLTYMNKVHLQYRDISFLCEGMSLKNTERSANHLRWQKNCK